MPHSTSAIDLWVGSDAPVCNMSHDRRGYRAQGQIYTWRQK